MVCAFSNYCCEVKHNENRFFFSFLFKREITSLELWFTRDILLVIKYPCCDLRSHAIQIKNYPLIWQETQQMQSKHRKQSKNICYDVFFSLFIIGFINMIVVHDKMLVSNVLMMTVVSRFYIWMFKLYSKRDKKQELVINFIWTCLWT